MKRKFTKILGLGLTLALLASMLVTGAPVSAAAVGTPTVTLSSYLALDTDVQHTISFNIGVSLGVGDDITITFPTAYITPTTWEDGDVTVDGTSVLGASVSTSGDVVTINLPASISTIDNPVVVVFTTAANIINPAAGTTYAISVNTTAETEDATSETYTILALPTVTAVEPNSGNVGDTMWVEVTGAEFTGDVDTNVSTTTINFGTGITVVSTKHVLATSIDCQITINTAGAAVVTAETEAGISTTTGTFTANDAGTPQVDVWEAYDLTADPFEAGTLDFQETFATITLGIGDAATTGGETVLVHADTYEESISIASGKDITLLSLSGADDTIIDGGAAVPVVDVYAIVTIDGFTIKGDATTAHQKGIIVRGAATEVDGFVIQNNIFEDTCSENIFVTSTNGAILSGTIDTNTFIGMGEDSEFGRSGILVESYSSNDIEGVVITNNTLSGYSADEVNGIGVAQSSGAVSAITVQDNIISDCFRGISLCGDVTALIGTEAISGNSITGCTAGFKASWGDGVEFELLNNTITGNTLYGVWLHDATPTAQNVVKYNDLSGNGEWGIYNAWGDSDFEVEAPYNWWGDISGPSAGTGEYASTALGSGDAMSVEVVTWDPWLTETQDTVITDGIRSYGSDAIELAVGWNTLSVPCGLKSTGDTFGEIEGMGTYLGDNFVGGYWYDASTGDWTLIGTTTTIEPGKGFYVNMSAASTFPVLLFDGLLSLPAYDMYAGWNLIGSMFGIDDTSYGLDTTETKTPSEALVSIAGNASVIISPSVPGQLGPWAAAATSSTDDMQVGEAYWVFMIADGTLAGWEVLPSCFEPGTMPD